MRRGSRAIPLLLLSVACQLLFLGCGYRPMGEGSLPHGLRRLYLSALNNGTYKPGVQGIVAAAILRRLQFDARVRLTSEPDAEATLGGTVTSYQNDPIAFEQTDIGLRFRVRLTLLFTLTDRQGGASVLKEEVVGEAYYSAGTTGVVATRAAEDETMQRAAQDLATKVVARLMEDL